MNEPSSTSASPFDFPEGHEPRRGRLLTSGIVLGLIGCLLGFLSALYLFIMPTFLGSTSAMAVPETEGMGDYLQSSMLLAGLFIGIAAAAFLITGAGGIFLKRWSRPFAFFLSGTWLYLGLFYLVYMLAFAGQIKVEMQNQMNEAVAAAPGGAAAAPPPVGADSFFGIFIVFTVTLIFIFGLALPAFILWLNWHRDVRVTLEFCDTKERWTDRCPIPVLNLVLGAIFCALSLLPAIVQAIFPFFGQFVLGPPAQIAYLAVAVILCAVAFGLYHQKFWAWLALVLLFAVGAVSGIMTSFQADYRQIYENMGMPEEMIDQSIRSVEIMWKTPQAIVISALFALPVIGYLIWSLRFFRPSPEPTATPA